MKYRSNSPEQTMEIAADFAKILKGGDIVALSGDLGAGKTVFTQGAAVALGVKNPVTSPTFCIMNIYTGEGLKLYHLDLYRIKSFSEAEGAGICEFIGKKDGAAFVEWAENVPGIFARADYHVKITGDKEKEIEII